MLCVGCRLQVLLPEQKADIPHGKVLDTWQDLSGSKGFSWEFGSAMRVNPTQGRGRIQLGKTT